MYKHILVLDDGTEIGAGTVGRSAIRSLTCTESVCGTDDLAPGGVCAARLEAELWMEPGTQPEITAGTRLTCWREQDGRRTPLGVFWAVKPTRHSRNTCRLTACDAVCRLDRDLSPWLRAHQADFPMRLTDFIEAVCAQCGVSPAAGTLDRLPNADYAVQRFYADDLTGRQLLQWAAQAAGRFVRAAPDGTLVFGWFEDRTGYGAAPGGDPASLPTALSLDGALLTTADGALWTYAQTQHGYFQGSLTYQDYETAPLDKVQIRQSDDDVGVLWPPDADGTNALVIQGNLLLTAGSADALRPVARTLYEQLARLRYTPLEVSLPGSDDAPAPGQIITVADPHGRPLQTCVMTRTLTQGKVRLQSTGNARRDGTAAVNNRSWRSLQGNMLEIRADIDGLNVTASELQGDYAQLSVTVGGIQTEVAGKLGQTEAQTLIDQSLRGLTLSATAGSQSSTLTLKAGATTLTSAEITFTGMVTFADLSGAGRSVINGSNITTGRIGNPSGNTLYDLDAGTLRTGISNGTRVEMNFNGIRWYSNSYLTGVLYSEYGKTYLGANSRYTFLGWFSGAYPSIGANKQSYDDNFGGLYYDQVDRLIHCVASKFEIPGRIECSSLSVNGREI